MAQSNDGVYVFPEAMSKAAGIDPGLLALLNSNGGFGNNGNWIWLMFMWMMWGYGGNGFGGFGGNNGGFLANQLANNEGRDLFDVSFIKSNKVVKSIDGVFFDSLVEVIDDFVEKTTEEIDEEISEETAE